MRIGWKTIEKLEPHEDKNEKWNEGDGNKWLEEKWKSKKQRGKEKPLSEILKDNPIIKQSKVIWVDLYNTIILLPKRKRTTKISMSLLRQLYYKIQMEEIDIRTAHETMDTIKVWDGWIDKIINNIKYEIDNAELDPDALEVLNKLKEKWYKLAAISNLSKEYEEPLRKLIPDGIFDYEALSFKVHSMKPKKEIFESVINQAKEKDWLNINMKDMVMVWDTPKHDVIWPINIWMSAIWLNKGAKKMEYDKKRGIIIIHTLKDLLDIL